jgi:tRNA (uracil-5-)-methyltransferase
MFRSSALRFISTLSSRNTDPGNLLGRFVPMSTRPAPDSQGHNGQSNKRQRGNHWKPKKTKREKNIEVGTNEQVLGFDIAALLASAKLEEALPSEATVGFIKPGESSSEPDLPEPFTEIDLTISTIASTGDGLALSDDRKSVYVVPFTSPGDIVRAKVIRHHETHSDADFVKVLTPGPFRDDSRINCRYFSTCAGCQLQMLPYEDQLAHKKTIIEKAYKNFFGLDKSLVPSVGNTIGSPLQYSYRTKLTPHFDGPPGGRRGNKRFERVPDIGFMRKGTRRTIDIEDCPIATDAVREGMKIERKKIAENFETYTKGVTLLLRETTERVPKSKATMEFEEGLENTSSDEPKTVPVVTEIPRTEVKAELEIVPTTSENVPAQADPSDAETLDTKTYLTLANKPATEYVGRYKFVSDAGAFFQNNNSILPTFTDYVRSHLHTSETEECHLVDAYCGSGLFTITCGSPFTSSTGIDISDSSIKSASINASNNNIMNATFKAATASAIFADVKSKPEQTSIIIDPPRKGCDDEFMMQLVNFGPRRIVYVSCNVHTQARDLGWLLKRNPGNGVDNKGGKGGYKIDSLRGFDFFPQTGHVESVAVLTRIE